MKKMWFTLNLFGAALLGAAPVLEVKALKDWSFSNFFYKSVTFQDGILKINRPQGHLVMLSTKIPVDLNKKYRVSAELRLAPGTASSGLVWFGVASYDQQGKIITSEMINFSPKNLTQLAAPAKKGDKSVLLKDAANWKMRMGYECIAFNAKADLSDLPNGDFSSRISSIKREGDNYRLTLLQPLTKNYPAGTVVRNHRSAATYFYVHGGKVPREWQKVERVLQGDAGKSGQAWNKWWTGTKSASCLIVVSRNVPVEFRNVKIEEL